ncbi:MAG: efflux RND transporter periplasmic adaptor subunit [Deltaproteobacteria bacterium]|nr:efflux RND transporter periplasmic adaptor subunit [Deltaproteobacteria bacterium]
MKNFFITLIVIILIAGGVSLFVYLAAKEKKAPVVFEIKELFVTDIVKKTVATGSIKPRKEVEIKPQVPGILQEVYVEPGQMVKKDDPIAKVQIIPEMKELNGAEARLVQAKIKYDHEKWNIEQQKETFKEGITTEQDYHRSEADYKNAKAEYEAAENNLEIIKRGVAKNTTTTNTLICSTMDGMILDVPVEIGDTVIQSNSFNAGSTIATVADMNDLIFEGKLDESEVGKIKIGMRLLITIGAIDNVEFNATLEHISPKGVEENGAILFPVRADVDLVDNIFVRAGYSATANIVLDKKEKVLAVNESVLQFDKDNKTFVEVEIAPQQFEKRYIETGISDSINIEVVSGIDKDVKVKVPKV